LYWFIIAHQYIIEFKCEFYEGFEERNKYLERKAIYFLVFEVGDFNLRIGKRQVQKTHTRCSEILKFSEL
jgi:hypothetical protein